MTHKLISATKRKWKYGVTWEYWIRTVRCLGTAGETLVASSVPPGLPSCRSQDPSGVVLCECLASKIATPISPGSALSTCQVLRTYLTCCRIIKKNIFVLRTYGAKSVLSPPVGHFLESCHNPINIMRSLPSHPRAEMNGKSAIVPRH